MSNSSTAIDLEALDGLESAKRMILRLGRDQAPTHAVLFYGMIGSGKSSLAQALTNAWICKNASEAPCGECQPCNAFKRGMAADVLRVEPQGASRWIKMEAIRPDKKSELISIQEFFRTSALTSRNKVVLIEDLDRLTSDAANALLKTLEEPPRHTKIVMTTSRPGAILPTIFSRCLAIRCDLPVLNPPADLEPELLASAGGSPGQLAQILDQLEWRRQWLAFVHDLRKMDRRDALAASDRFRSLAEKGPHESVRQQGAQALEIFSDLYRGTAFAQEAISEAHRYIVGNGNSGIVTDALFAKILGEPRRTAKS